MRKIIIIALSAILMVILLITFNLLRQMKHDYSSKSKSNTYWEVQSIDTVKYSRDLAREKLNDTSFDAVIDDQVKLIASTGANYIALGTPYDKEFTPYLVRWVKAARKYGLKVWFRGNFSGWEKWFGYKSISRSEHTSLIKDFILNNSSLFADGDIFTSCTECENGGPGDPRKSGDVNGFRDFLINEYKTSQEAFSKIGKKVTSNYYSMNMDVALLVMDKQTTKELGGVVVVDHYVKEPGKLVNDLITLSQKSGGKVVLGEFGVPILDINGNFGEYPQANWIGDALSKLSLTTGVIGVNYWTGFGGSTSLRNSDNSPKLAVSMIREFFKPSVLSGRVVTFYGKGVSNAQIYLGIRSTVTDSQGYFNIPYLYDTNTLIVITNGNNYTYTFNKTSGDKYTTIIIKPDWLENLLK